MDFSLFSSIRVTGRDVMSGTSTVPSASYAQRAIDVTIQLGEGSFGLTGQNTVKLSGLRAVATIQKYGFPGFDTATLRVYGIQPSVMNAVSTLGAPLPMARNNTVQISAGDAVNGMANVFQGTINDAWQDFDDAPDTFLSIVGQPGGFEALRPVPAISFPGGADVATIVSGIATTMNRAFVNNGVKVHLANPYFAGTALEQAHEVARAANIELYDDGATIWIWPRNGVRFASQNSALASSIPSSPAQTSVPLISAASGMIGNPRWTSQGCSFRCLFNPSIQAGGPPGSPQFGGVVRIESKAIPSANAMWYVNSLVLNLSAQVPGGPWECAAECSRLIGAPPS